MTWTKHDFSGIAQAIVADGNRLVAAGNVGENQRAAWTSSDGLNWEMHAVPAPSTAHCEEGEPCIERTAQMGPMVRLDDTLYSLGNTTFINDYIKAVAWRWTDGQDWQVVESRNPIYYGGGFRAAATSDSSIFAVTHAGYPFTERHWLWQPTTSWQEVGAEISLDNPIGFSSVAWHDGAFLAVGTTTEVDPDVPDDEWPAKASVWSSRDGVAWTETAAPSEAGTFCSVTSTHDAFLAVGLDKKGWPMTWSWTSDAGWTTGAKLPAPSPVHATMGYSSWGCVGGVVELTSGLLAFVCDETSLTWLSPDATTWTDAGRLDLCAAPSSVAALGDTVIVLGKLASDNVEQELFVGTATLR